MNEKETMDKSTDDLVEFGVVSEETKGAVFGWTWDGGSSRRWP